MDTKLLNEVIACLPKGKTHFRYFEGAYALKLLTLLMPQEVSVADAKQSQYAKLLQTKLLKPLLANSGGGSLRKEQIDHVWQEPSLPFLLTVSRWGGHKDWKWNQVSRPGENLVLQLNLPMEHERLFKRWFAPEGEYLFNRSYGHPVQRKRSSNTYFRETLAWARIDLDLDNNEALIEEIQSDGVRDMRFYAKRFTSCGCKQCQQRLQYLDWFALYGKLWSEAMLMATIEFLKIEIGVEHIYMHTDRSGWKLKHMSRNWRAPKSLYSALPKKFTFQRTYGAPLFLQKAKPYKQLIKKQPEIDFHYLSLAA